VKAVLLAAGLGTRLSPITGAVPKILAPVAGEPLLGRQLRYLATCGFETVAVNLHHQADSVEHYLSSIDAPLEVVVYREVELRGTAGALFPMRDLLTERFIVLYGDVVTDADLRQLYGRSHGLATLAYYVSSDVRDKGLLDIDADGRVVSFVEKPVRSGDGFVNAGVYVLDPAILDFIPAHGDFGFDVWPRVLASGEAIYAVEIDGYLLDMGNPAALRRLEDDVRRGALSW
jgi:NDP-sugar pyrophosphorylase family protein